MLDSPEYSAIRAALIEWSKASGLGALLRDVHIHDDGHVLRWSQVSITLRTNHRRRPVLTSGSGLDRELPPLPYTVDKDGIRHYPTEQEN